MESGGEPNVLDKLQHELGVKWPTLNQARLDAGKKKKELLQALSPYESEDTSIVVFGSLARDEFTSGSDIDWTLLVDGLANPEHQDNSAEVSKHIRGIEGRAPGREGTFGGLTFSHDLIHKIGGGDDTNRNTTQRILLLLESVAIGRRDAYERVIKNVLSRYVREDYGLIFSTGPYRVPRFLQNDIARFWRTVAVDFAYKQRQRGDAGWALRTAKLRLSRKLIYASGLLMCFECHSAIPAEEAGGNRRSPESQLHAYVEHLWKSSQKTPLEILAGTFLRCRELDDVACKFFDTYDKFLALIDDNVVRAHLEALAREEVAGSEIFEKMRILGHDFQECLDKLFFEENAAELYKLTKVYGVF
jgi:predicted nucleotidyltransferase